MKQRNNVLNIFTNWRIRKNVQFSCCWCISPMMLIFQMSFNTSLNKLDALTDYDIIMASNGTLDVYRFWIARQPCDEIRQKLFLLTHEFDSSPFLNSYVVPLIKAHLSWHNIRTITFVFKWTEQFSLCLMSFVLDGKQINNFDSFKCNINSLKIQQIQLAFRINM